MGWHWGTINVWPVYSVYLKNSPLSARLIFLRSTSFKQPHAPLSTQFSIPDFILNSAAWKQKQKTNPKPKPNPNYCLSFISVCEYLQAMGGKTWSLEKRRFWGNLTVPHALFTLFLSRPSEGSHGWLILESSPRYLSIPLWVLLPSAVCPDLAGVPRLTHSCLEFRGLPWAWKWSLAILAHYGSCTMVIRGRESNGTLRSHRWEDVCASGLVDFTVWCSRTDDGYCECLSSGPLRF